MTLGTVNEQVNAPSLFVVMVVPVKVPTVHPVGVSRTPSKLTVAEPLGVKPDPVTVYAAPTGPRPGDTVIAGVEIVNVAAA